MVLAVDDGGVKHHFFDFLFEDEDPIIIGRGLTLRLGCWWIVLRRGRCWLRLRRVLRQSRTPKERQVEQEYAGQGEPQSAIREGA